METLALLEAQSSVENRLQLAQEEIDQRFTDLVVQFNKTFDDMPRPYDWALDQTDYDEVHEAAPTKLFDRPYDWAVDDIEYDLLYAEEELFSQPRGTDFELTYHPADSHGLFADYQPIEKVNLDTEEDRAIDRFLQSDIDNSYRAEDQAKLLTLPEKKPRRLARRMLGAAAFLLTFTTSTYITANIVEHNQKENLSVQAKSYK